jgi:cytochrome c oxidase cbb3-type subunit 2
MSPHRHPVHIDRAKAVSAFAGVSAIFSVHVFFLLFAEFAFIEHARLSKNPINLTALVITLTLAGVAGCLAAARGYRPEKGTQQLSLGFIACAVAAAFSMIARNLPLALIAAVMIGASLAWTTVTLSLCLRPTLHLKKLGAWCGLGTGLAYAFCNLPPVFTATPGSQTVIAIFAALLGFVVSFRLNSEPAKPSTSPEYKRFGAGLWVVLFLILALLNSAAFFIIGHVQLLSASTWDGTLNLQGNAFVHLCTAVIAGLALDRRQLHLTVGAALLAFILACLLLNGSGGALPASRVCYTIGASVYSTILVYYIARGGRAWLAGVIFAASGWVGSAGGLGMAQSLQAVPVAFVVTVAIVAIAAFVTHHFWLRNIRILATENPFGIDPR